MKQTTIREALGMEAGQDVLAISGTVTSVYERKASAPGATRAWSVQNLVIGDNGSSIKLAFWDRAEFGKDMKGRPVLLKATKNGKGKWAGLLIEHHTPEGKPVEVRIKVSLSAELSYAGMPEGSGTGDPSDNDGGEAPRNQGATSARPSAPAARNAPPVTQARQTSQRPPAQEEHHEDPGSEGNPGEEAGAGHSEAPPVDPAESKRLLEVENKRRAIAVSKQFARMGNGYKLALQRAEAVAKWHADYSGRGAWAPGEVKDLATTFFIQLQKEGGIFGLPDNKDVEEYLPSLQKREVGASGSGSGE